MIDFSMLEARDYILLVAAPLVIYGVFAVLRLLQLGGPRGRPEATRRPEGSPVGAPFLVARAEVRGDVARGESQGRGAARPASVSVDAEESASIPDFPRELARSSLDLEFQQLRQEVAQLREETKHLAAEVWNLKMARNVAPIYGEAMTLAQQGEPPAGIAAQCGISVGEAELVAALARREPGSEPNKKK